MAAATTMPSTAGRKKKVHPFHIFKYVFLILASIISIFPFLWMIICATNDAVDINRGTVTFGTSLFKNLQNLFVTDHGFLKALGNSAIIAVITTVLALLVSSAAGSVVAASCLLPHPATTEATMVSASTRLTAFLFIVILPPK